MRQTLVWGWKTFPRPLTIIKVGVTLQSPNVPDLNEKIGRKLKSVGQKNAFWMRSRLILAVTPLI